MTTQDLATKIYESTALIYSKDKSVLLMNYISALLHYKYLSDKQKSFLESQNYTTEQIKALSEEDTKTVNYLKESLGYFISYEHLFSHWIELRRLFDMGNVSDSIHAFNRLNATNEYINRVNSLIEGNYSKNLGETSRDASFLVCRLIYQLNDIQANNEKDLKKLVIAYEQMYKLLRTYKRKSTLINKLMDFLEAERISI